MLALLTTKIKNIKVRYPLVTSCSYKVSRKSTVSSKVFWRGGGRHGHDPPRT
jgi:hypothetical protein